MLKKIILNIIKCDNIQLMDKDHIIIHSKEDFVQMKLLLFKQNQPIFRLGSHLYLLGTDVVFSYEMKKEDEK